VPDQDLIEIWTSIAINNREAADRALDAVERRWQQLSEHPLSGPERNDIEPGIQHLVSGTYLALYRVTNEGVEILRVIHGHRDLAGPIYMRDPRCLDTGVTTPRFSAPSL